MSIARPREDLWLSFHIFYHANLDTLLLECVSPLVAQLRKERRISKYFFIRYWNGGPHIRLRVMPVSVPESLRRYICSEIKGFLQRKPGGTKIRHEEYLNQTENIRMAGRRLDLQEEVESLQPADDVQVREYIYEANRYGQEDNAKSITEEHFCHSSDMAKFIVQETIDQVESRFTVGLHLTAATAFVLGVTPLEAAFIFLRVSESLKVLFPSGAKEVSELFESRGFVGYEEQRLHIEPVIAQLHNGGAVLGNADAINKLILAWQNELRNKLSCLRRLCVRYESLPRSSGVAMDYLHMLNNRLGIPVDQECYAYYLVGSAMREELGHQTTF